MISLWVSLGLLVLAVLLALRVLLSGNEPRGAIALLISAFLGSLSVVFMWLAYHGG